MFPFLSVMIFGGFFLNNTSIPAWLEWLKYISWFMYSNELLVVNQWEGIQARGQCSAYMSGSKYFLFAKFEF